MKRFAIAFITGLFAFAVANVVSAAIRSDDPDAPDSADRYGFPVLIFAEDHYHDPNPYFSRMALCADVGVAMLVSSLAGVICLKVGEPKLLKD